MRCKEVSFETCYVSQELWVLNQKAAQRTRIFLSLAGRFLTHKSSFSRFVYDRYHVHDGPRLGG